MTKVTRTKHRLVDPLTEDVAARPSTPATPHSRDGKENLGVHLPRVLLKLAHYAPFHARGAVCVSRLCVAVLSERVGPACCPFLASRAAQWRAWLTAPTHLTITSSARSVCRDQRPNPPRYTGGGGVTCMVRQHPLLCITWVQM